MKKADALLGDSSAMLRFEDDDALREVDEDHQFRWQLAYLLKRGLRKLPDLNGTPHNAHLIVVL